MSADTKWTERPTAGAAFIRRFQDAEELTISLHGTGVRVIGWKNGGIVARIACDSPGIVTDIMRMAYADDWKAASLSTAEDVARYYARGGTNWSGD